MTFRQVKLSDVMVLLECVARGARHPDVGYEDADRAYDDTITILDKPVSVPIALVNSALWSGNLLDERGAFYHPRGLTYDAFLERLLEEGEVFNKDYNFIEKEKK